MKTSADFVSLRRSQLLVEKVSQYRGYKFVSFTVYYYTDLKSTAFPRTSTRHKAR